MDEALERTLEGRRVASALARARATASRALDARRAEVLCACLLLLMAFNLFAVNFRKSVTNDEMYHIPAGYYYLVAGDFRFNDEHPPLVKMWAALPLLLLQPEETPASVDSTGEIQKRFWGDNKEVHESITFWTRAMMIPLTLALGWLLFACARRLFGDRAAVLSVALFSLEPTMLAHGRIVHTDVPAALAYLLASVAVYAYCRRPTWRRACALGVLLGVALLTKFSMVVLLPFVALVFVALAWRSRRRREPVAPLAAHAGLVCALVLLLANAAYYFQRAPVDADAQNLVRMLSPSAASGVIDLLRALSYPLPTRFLTGFYKVLMHSRDGHPASLFGQHGATGWWYYFPAAFALKTTIPFLAVTVAAIFYSLWRLIVKRDGRFLLALAPLALYTLFALANSINIGIRHLLPAFPFLFITGGALLDRALCSTRARRAAQVCVVGALVWMAVEVVRVHPNYIPYLNQLASRGQSWQYLSDSNVEWGEDVGELCEYLKARGETEVRGAILNGLGSPRLYGVQYYEAFPKPGRAPAPETRYVAVGASFLNGSPIAVVPGEGQRALTDEERVNYLAEYRVRTPEAVFGGTIYLYRVRD